MLLPTKVIMLILTHGCNLSCTYCYEPNKAVSIVMNVSVAKGIIEGEVEKCKNATEVPHLVILFMGGEPLLQFDVIREICEWVEEKSFSIKVSFAATTNGTLMGRHKDWLFEHRDRLKLTLSVDGNSFMQDINRSASSSKIDYDFYLSAWPDGKVKMTLSPMTINHVYEGVISLHERGFKNIEGNIALGPSIKWDDKHLSDYRIGLHQLVDFYIEHPQIAPVSMLDYDLTRIFSAYDWRKRCRCGEDFVCYDTDGKIYPCHILSPVSLGDEELEELEFHHWDSLVSTKS